MTWLHKGTVIDTFEQLEQGLRDWRSFADREVYDVAGMMALLCACVANLRENALHAEIVDMGASLTSEERQFLRTLIETK